MCMWLVVQGEGTKLGIWPKPRASFLMNHNAELSNSNDKPNPVTMSC